MTEESSLSCMPNMERIEPDLYPLAMVMDYMMEFYGIPSHYFLSNMFSESKRSLQLQVVINALERFKHVEIQNEAPEHSIDIEICEKSDLPNINTSLLSELKQYDVLMTEYSIDELLKHIQAEGLGDWCLFEASTSEEHNKVPAENIGVLRDVNTPILSITDINTNINYILTKKMLMKSVNEVWIDFPWAVNKGVNSDLDVSLLSKQDIDEIIQVAVLGELVYPYPW